MESVTPTVETDNAVFAQVVDQQTKQLRRHNTAVAYDPKVLEFKSFCSFVFSCEPEFVRDLVTPDKVFNFMFYQCYREKRKAGGKGKGSGGTFPVVDYNRVMDQYRNTSREEWTLPMNPLGYSAINTYRSSIQGLFKEQQAQRANSYVWEQIWNIRCEDLAQLMKKRKTVISRALYEEKVDHQFSSYKATGQGVAIENEFFKRSCDTNLRSAFSWTRNRFVFLFTKCGILRCESVYKAELSDLLHVKGKAPKDVHGWAVLVMQIAVGK
jgi:hypothetical protein